MKTWRDRNISCKQSTGKRWSQLARRVPHSVAAFWVPYGLIVALLLLPSLGSLGLANTADVPLVTATPLLTPGPHTWLEATPAVSAAATPIPSSQEGPATLTPSAVPTAQNDADQLRQAILAAVAKLTTDGRYYYSLDYIIVDTDWALAVLAPRVSTTDEYLPAETVFILARRESGRWVGALMGKDPQFIDWIELAPDSVMHKSLREFLLDNVGGTGELSTQLVPNLKLPWFPRDNPQYISGYLYNEGTHKGVDAWAQDWSLVNKDVAAAASGTTVEMVCNLPNVRDDSKGYGNYVLMDIGGGVFALYAHLQSCSMSMNQWYPQGATVGRSGTSGYSTGPHLHFRLRDSNRNPVLPEPISGYTNIRKGVNYYSDNGGQPSCDATSIPSGYTKCADEGGRCNFSGTKQVYYGANSCFKVKSFSNGVDCNNNNFGDPVPGTQKACYVEPDSPPPSCNPNADQIALFVDANYSGQCVVKGIGQYPNPGAIGLPNDSISSIKVGGNVQAILCRDDNYGGGCETFTSDDSNLSDNSIGNDQVSSAKVELRPSPCNPNADQVALFVDADYRGQCVVKGIGQYPNPGAIGLPNDSISSVKVGGNVKAILCRDDNYGGGCETFTSNDSNLSDNSIGNDQVSSAKVEQRLQPPNAPSNLSATAVSASQINLSWRDNSDNETGFKIYRNGSYLTSVGANVTGYQNTGLNCGTSYSYYVKAYNSAGESETSNTASATTQACGPAITVDGVSVDWCQGGGASVQEISAGPLPVPVKVERLQTQLAAQPSGPFQIGRKICMGIGATNHTVSAISTYWSWTTYNSSGVKIQQLSYDDWPWTMNPGGAGAGWGPTIPYNLTPGLYTFVGSIRYDSSVASKSTTFSIIGVYGDSADFDGDGRVDPAVWNPTNGKWSIKGSKGQSFFPTWGGQGNTPAPGNYDGDGKTDIATWNPANGKWSIKGSKGQNLFPTWGGQNDIPVPGDYDGDGKTDIATWNPANGKWYIKGSKGQNLFPTWGGQNNIPVPGDYDGDGKTDIATWNPASGKWYIKGSKGQSLFPTWGGQNNIPVPGDYDGDGKTDIATWNPASGKWYIKGSKGQNLFPTWGGQNNIPVPGDYDGDGKTDIATWNPANGKWYIKGSKGQNLFPIWGGQNNIPVSVP